MSHRLCVEPVALQLKRQASVGQIAHEHRSFVVVEPPIGSRVLPRRNEHVGPAEQTLSVRVVVTHSDTLADPPPPPQVPSGSYGASEAAPQSNQHVGGATSGSGNL